MAAREDSEMLELCESEIDDLKTMEVPKETESPKPSSINKSDINESVEMQENLPEELENLYTSMGINLKDQSSVSHIRLDTIHIHGVDDMSTKDVYSLFHPMKPMTLEWINDSSCNVVWPDDSSAAKALLEISHTEETQTVATETKKSSSNIPDEKDDNNQIIVVEEDDDDDVVEEGSEDGELPEQKEVKKVFWRITKQENGKVLKFRFATWDDKKVRGAEKYSEYYKKYGNPNFGGLKGLISGSRKRKIRQGIPVEDNSYSAEDPEEEDFSEDVRHRISPILTDKTERRDPSQKRRKMKMYADEEERRTQKLKSGRILNRLGNVTVNISLEDEEDSGKHDYDELEISSPQEFGSKSVWDRLQVEVPNTQYSYRGDKKRSHRSSEHGNQRDLRKKLQTIRNNKKDHTSPLLLPTTTK